MCVRAGRWSPLKERSGVQRGPCSLAVEESKRLRQS